jgi:hypothetical protein
LTITGLSAREKVPLVDKRGQRGQGGDEKGMRKCKHSFKLQFSSSMDIKTKWDYDFTLKMQITRRFKY